MRLDSHTRTRAFLSAHSTVSSARRGAPRSYSPCRRSLALLTSLAHRSRQLDLANGNHLVVQHAPRSLYVSRLRCRRPWRTPPTCRSPTAAAAASAPCVRRAVVHAAGSPSPSRGGTATDARRARLGTARGELLSAGGAASSSCRRSCSASSSLASPCGSSPPSLPLSSTWLTAPKKSVRSVWSSGRGKRSLLTPGVERITSCENVSNCAREAEDRRVSLRVVRSECLGEGEGAHEVLHRDLRRLIDRLEEGEDVVRVAVRDGDANVVVGVMLRQEQA